MLLIALNSFAQLGKEAWHWQFGQNCALDFSSGGPVASTSSLDTLEGCASYSDPNTGQLLFYTDGTKVWDKNNNQMPNGYGLIGGYGTSTQAALIVPKPGSPNLFYLFSADQGGYYYYNSSYVPNQGVHYSIVDMSLNGGLGDVTTKNVLVTPPPTTEKLTAVRHCNGTDYWVITHPFNSKAFNVYLLNASGLSAMPVVSNVGTTQSNIGGMYNETIGYLKASPNGKKLAMAVCNDMDFVELFDFDNASGLVTNTVVKINYGYPYISAGAYGVAFSPDNSKLYVTREYSGLFQYDISSNNGAAILASQYNLSSNLPGGFIGSVQLATDGKIYLSTINNSSALAVINYPNKPGIACNFSLNGPTLAPGTKSLAGLPNFIEANHSFHSQSYSIPLCSFPNYTLITHAGNSYQWQTGDTTQSISINSFGDYWVSYINSSGCREIDTFHVTQITPPIINILKDTAQCANAVSSINLNASDTGNVNYLWNDGTTNPVNTISDTGTYWVNYTFSNFCISRDSFTYKTNNIPTIHLGNDTTFCIGHLPLNAYNPNSTYIWNNGETTNAITVTKPGNYWVKVTNQYHCTNNDTLVVIPDTALFNFVMPNIVTPNNDDINDYIDFGKYQFSNMQLNIYNRWGKLIFESSNPAIIWKPTEDDGTYYYVLQYHIDCGNETQSKNLKGFITVLR